MRTQSPGSAIRGHFAAAIACIALGACASVTATKVSRDDGLTNPDAKGIRYWLAMPYLIVRTRVEVSRTDEIMQLRPGEAALQPLKTLAAGTGAAGGAAHGDGAALPPAPKAPDGVKTAKGAPPVAAIPKQKAGDSGGKGGGDGGVGKGPATPGDSAGAPEPSAGTPTESALSVVWLPDYCEQFALEQTSFLSKLETKFTLEDGWRLASVESKSDSTDIVGKVLDLVGAIKGVSAPAPSKPSDGAATAGTDTTTASDLKYVRKTTVKYLKPGIYPLFKRDEGNGTCKGARTFDTSAFTAGTSVESVYFSEFVFTPNPK